MLVHDRWGAAAGIGVGGCHLRGHPRWQVLDLRTVGDDPAAEMAVHLRHGAASYGDEGRGREAKGNAAAPPSVVRTALRRGSTRRGHLLGEVTPSLVRHACVDHIQVDHRLVEQLVSDLAERVRPRYTDPR